MIFSFITQQELLKYFSSSFGYNSYADDFGVYIFSNSKSPSEFIFLKIKSSYWVRWIYLNLWIDKQILNIPWKVEFYRLLMHTELDRATASNSKQSK